MKIVHVVDSMDVGGAEILVSQMCRLQRNQGHDPCVYAVSTLGELGEQMRTDGFVVQPHMGRGLQDASRNFLRAFRELQPDIVHLHNPTPTIFAGPAARMAGVPSIVSTRHSLVAPPRKLVMELKYGIAARFCDWIVGICDATTNNLKDVHGSVARKIVRVYNGAVPLSRAANEQWPPRDGFTLVFVGRLEPIKNHALLFRALQGALTATPTLRLWMVGDGSERPRLERLATELGIATQVTFWGRQVDVAPFLSGADAFVMSSTSEGLPISLLQAFSLGLPSIVTDVGGMAEVVRSTKAGYTVSVVTDPAEMAAAMVRMESDEAERREFSANAQAMFHSRFTVDTMVEAYMRLYQNTARARRAAKAR